MAPQNAKSHRIQRNKKRIIMINIKPRKQFADTVLNLGKKNNKIVVLVSDISHGIFKPFAKLFKKRYYNVGICEQSIVNMAAGLKKTGFIPVIHTIAPFLIERSYEQIKLDFGYQKIGVNLVSVGGTFDYTKLGCSHHCYSDFSLLNHFDNCNIVVPGSALEFDIIFKKIYSKNKINYFRLTENPHGYLIDRKKIQLGKAIKIKNGKDLTILAVGPKLKDVMKCCNYFQKYKKEIEVLYYHTLKPFDKSSLIKSLRKTKKLLVVEEFSSKGGVFDECLRSTKDIKNVKYESISVQPFIHHYGSYEYLSQKAKTDLNSIIRKANKLLNKK